MRGLRTLTRRVRRAIAQLVFIAGASLVGAATAQAASFSIDCPLPCSIDRGSHVGVDYTVPPDGRTYRWDIAYQSDDPGGYVALDAPNQVEAFLERSLGGGATASEFVTTVDFLWSPISYAPDVASYLVRAPADFDTCAADTPAGVICAATYHVWGNGTQLWAFGNAPVTVLSLTETRVPEPATWAVLVLGFLGVGVMLRSRNRLAAAPA